MALVIHPVDGWQRSRLTVLVSLSYPTKAQRSSETRSERGGFHGGPRGAPKKARHQGGRETRNRDGQLISMVCFFFHWESVKKHRKINVMTTYLI